MKTIEIIIERSKDGFFWAYSNDEESITAGGETVDKCMKGIQDCIETLATLNNPPSFLKQKYTLIYHFDVESLLAYYEGIFTKSALERLTGINQRQISHYATGLKKPRLKQRKKIEKALHRLGKELLTVQL